MLKVSHGRLRAPAGMLVLGTGLSAAVLAGQGWHNAVEVELVTVIAAVGYFVLGGLDNDVGAIYGSRPDERQQMIRLRAQALTAVATIFAAIIAFMVQIARRAPTWPFLLIVAVAGTAFIAGLVIFRIRDNGQVPQ